jgi:hypothetical protein
MYEERIEDLQERTSLIKKDFEQFRQGADQTINGLRD